MVQPQRPSISIKECYAKDAREIRLFDTAVQGPAPNFLLADQLSEAFPAGIINRWTFTHRGHSYRIHRAVDRVTSRMVYLAVDDDDDVDPVQEEGRAYRRSLFSHPSFPSSSKRAPPTADSTINSFSPWTTNEEDMLEGPSSDAYSPRSDTLARGPPSRSLSSPMPHSHSHGHGHGHNSGHNNGDCSTKFARDIMSATSSLVPLERYKSLVGLMSTLRREMTAAGLADVGLPEVWEAQSMHTLLRSIVMVGECLAKFGSADFNEGSNTTRAITAKDYAALLRQYLQSYGFIFQEQFVAGMTDLQLQDEMMTVSNLLQTRCDANDLIFGQLIKHVGLEGGRQGGSTVYNSTVVSANPNNSVQCSPTTTTTTSNTSSSVARLKSMTSGGWGMVAVAGVALLGMLVKGRMGGGKSGRGRKKGSEEPETRGPAAAAQGVSNFQRMMDSERLAVATLAGCQQELERSRQNTELLENDWRLGKLRLSTPSTPYPPGYKEVDTTKCDLKQFYQLLRSDSMMHQMGDRRA